jgi:hypothetical protein
MQAVLSEWLGLGEEQGASEEYLDALRKLLAVLDKSKSVRDFLEQAKGV